MTRPESSDPHAVFRQVLLEGLNIEGFEVHRAACAECNAFAAKLEEIDRDGLATEMWERTRAEFDRISARRRGRKVVVQHTSPSGEAATRRECPYE